MATKRVDYRVFDEKYCIYTVKNNVLEGFLVSMFEMALEHGKIEENNVNSGIFNGLVK